MAIEFAKSVAVDFWATLAEMSPYLLFGFLVAGLLSVLVSESLVRRHLGGRGLLPLLKASVLGVPLPLCSCGVIPVSMSLHKHGASKGSTIAFLLSTPQTGIDSIFVTLSLLGPVFAIFRPLVALITGLVGGSIVDAITTRDPTEGSGRKDCQDECCNSNGKGKIARAFRYGFVTLPRDIGKAMLVGLLVAAVLSAVVPNDYLAESWLAQYPLLAMVVMLFLGIPVYVCATASVPVAAVLIMKGLSPGAALVFLMTGPATNAASFATIWKALGRKTAIAYLAAVAGCALASGALLDYASRGFDFEVFVKPGRMLPPVVMYISAIVLLAVLAAGILSKKKGDH